jgi:uncharacterized membrane protein (DUF485 family)
MMDGRASDPFGPVILGLTFIVVTPALVGLTSDELPTTLTATPLWQGVSAIILLGLITLIALWIVSRASVHLAAAVGEGGDD